MRVNIINYEQALGINGILSKYAEKMTEEAIKLGYDAKLTVNPDDSDINHHINYISYRPSGRIDTMMVTHVWPGEKEAKLKEGLKTATGICFSKETADRYKDWGRIETVLPAHDELPRRQKLVYIPTNVYPCKRAEMIKEIKSDCYFVIMGRDWQPILKDVTLSHDYIDHFNKEAHIEILKRADYCLYFGLDEGSMGILDAVQAGVRTIAPLQGFHIETGIDYPFNTAEELNKIFEKIEHNPVKDWTWENYVKAHIALWEKLL